MARAEKLLTNRLQRHVRRLNADDGAIQKAIDTAAPKKETVSFKPGTYLTGALFLKSGVTFESLKASPSRVRRTSRTSPNFPPAWPASNSPGLPPSSTSATPTTSPSPARAPSTKTAPSGGRSSATSRRPTSQKAYAGPSTTTPSVSASRSSRTPTTSTTAAASL